METSTRIWPLDTKVTFLNHGSFGSCPLPVLEYQREMRDRLERQPVYFLVRELEPLMDVARATLAEFVGARPENLVFVNNATSGVNTILRSLDAKPGDEWLVTDQEYKACHNALEFAAARVGVKVVVAKVPFPFQKIEEVIEPILACVTPRTKLALIDHVTSQTGMIMPVETLIKEFSERGIDTLVDGAHAPGMIPLHLEKLGAAYYTGNCHKWLCSPKTAALLWVRPDKQEQIHPLTISHGFTTPRKDRSRFLVEFGWPGTADPTPCLSVVESLRFLGSLFAGGWPEIMARNGASARAGRKILCDALNVPPPCPEQYLGSMASVPLPDSDKRGSSPLFIDPLQDELLNRFNIEVPVVPWPGYPKRLIRISAQLYNTTEHWELLAKALREILGL